jgi:hypothetical protein
MIKVSFCQFQWVIIRTPPNLSRLCWNFSEGHVMNMKFLAILKRFASSSTRRGVNSPLMRTYWIMIRRLKLLFRSLQTNVHWIQLRDQNKTY